MRCVSSPPTLVVGIDDSRPASVARLCAAGSRVTLVRGAGAAFAACLNAEFGLVCIVVTQADGAALTALAAIRGSIGSAPLFLIAERIDAAAVVAALAAGADDVLCQPLDAALLAERLRLVAARKARAPRLAEAGAACC